VTFAGPLGVCSGARRAESGPAAGAYSGGGRSGVSELEFGRTARYIGGGCTGAGVSVGAPALFHARSAARLPFPAFAGPAGGASLTQHHLSKAGQPPPRGEKSRNARYNACREVS
jgi:hypothetical protein